MTLLTKSASGNAARSHIVSRHERGAESRVPPRRHSLSAIFEPKNVAVIGASEKSGSVGRALVENLRAWKGAKFCVNPNHREVLGTPTFSSVGDIPQTVDLAIIAVPAVAVPQAIRDCARARVGGAVILSAGFKECGNDGAVLECEVLAEARKGGLRIIGPNCLGVMMPHANLNATFAATAARPGNVAFLSQSGALCTAVLDWSLEENVGFSAFVSVGSMLDVGWGDLITWFGDDPRTKSIVCYMESIGDARSFLSVAREVALTKLIIVLKVGRTTAGIKAAISHTGALTGSDAVVDAALRRVGVLRVETIEELFDMAEVLAKQPRPRGPRLAIVTNAGGPAALAADGLASSGGQLAELSAPSMETLHALLPAHWSHGNPIDVLSDASAERFGKAVEIAANDANTDGVLAILTPQAMTDATATAQKISALAHVSNKPVLASWMGGAATRAGEAILNNAGIPTFQHPDRAARAFELMWRYSENLRSLYETPTLCGDSDGCQSSSTAKVGTIIREARLARRSLLTEVEAKEILAAYGLPCVETHVAFTEDDAVKHAERIGFPVVLKLFSERLTHKSDIGGVQLNLGTMTAVRRTWRSIHDSVAEKAGKRHFLGVTVQRMVAAHGHELILGSSVDPQFGPVILFGAGGQFVEVFNDTAIGLPPLNTTLARRLIERTRVSAALRGTRGRAAVDLDKLAAILVRFSRLVAEQPWISEIDINPLLASAEGFVVLDARVALHSGVSDEQELPKPAIRPYPSQYIAPWTLKDGTAVTIRPIRPEDEPLMVEFHRTLSERSVDWRYFTPLKLDVRVAHERLSRICFIDYDREMVLVVEGRKPQSDKAEISGVGRLSKLHGGSEAEFALLISDAWQGHGLGTELLRTLVQVGRDEKLERITATILNDNHVMLNVARRAGFALRGDSAAHAYQAELKL